MHRSGLALEEHGDDALLASVPRTDVRDLVRLTKEKYAGRITGEVVIPARLGSYADFPADLDPRLADALHSRGIAPALQPPARSVGRGRRWATHGRRHADRVRQDALLQPARAAAAINEQAKALYLFPTKALAQDQVAELLELNTAGDLGVRAFTFDGDTPGDARQAVRTATATSWCRTPTCCTRESFPHHTKWAQFFESLRYVVIDEMHTYRGVFGSHMANVLRRLLRVCAASTARTPMFIFCSATIANPAELAQQLLGQPVTAITESGAPQGEKHLLLWNPPVINPDLGLRASARSQTTRIARAAIKAGLQDDRVRQLAADGRSADQIPEGRLRPRSAQAGAHRAPIAAAICPPSAREYGRPRCAPATLDCIVDHQRAGARRRHRSARCLLLNGYPGTIAGTWQRLGRAGRRNRPSLGVLVATSDAARPVSSCAIPDFFIGASPEHARIAPGPAADPDRPRALRRVRAAVHRGRTLRRREPGRDAGLSRASTACCTAKASAGTGSPTAIRRTASACARLPTATSWSSIAPTDASRSSPRSTIRSAALTLYEGAIYLVQAEPWQVERLDWEGARRSSRAPTPTTTPTRSTTRSSRSSTASRHASRHHGSTCVRGEVHVVRRVAGYKKIRYYTHENVGYGPVNLPDHEMHTTAVWWQIDPRRTAGCASPHRWHALDGFLGAAYAMHSIAAAADHVRPPRSGPRDRRWRRSRGSRSSDSSRARPVAAGRRPSSVDVATRTNSSPRSSSTTTIPAGSGSRCRSTICATK